MAAQQAKNEVSRLRTKHTSVDQHSLKQLATPRCAPFNQVSGKRRGNENLTKYFSTQSNFKQNSYTADDNECTTRPGYSVPGGGPSGGFVVAGSGMLNANTTFNGSIPETS
jgi:hypothetical protein